jgi:hypothetical protein
MKRLRFWFQRGRTSGPQSPVINKSGPGDVNVNFQLLTAQASQLARATVKENWPRRPPNLPYNRLGRLFKGRASLIEQLRHSLTRADIMKKGVVSTALHGLGGIGKTRLAVEYAYEYENEYNAILFVVADTPETLGHNFAALIDHLELAEGEATKQGVRLQAVLHWLEVNSPWLLILDNVDSEAALEKAGNLMGQLRGGHVIITSRLRNFPADVVPLEVVLLPEEAAIDFLLERTAQSQSPADDNKEQARLLAVEDLGRLALALEHAGAYIVRHGMSFRKYRELWNKSRDKVMGWSDPAVTHYPHAIAVTWQTSVANVTQSARHLLEVLAWFAPDPIPDFVLDVPTPWAKSENNLREALADLAAYSLVTRTSDAFSVHGLVQEVTRCGIDADTSDGHLPKIIRWINVALRAVTQHLRIGVRESLLEPPGGCRRCFGPERILFWRTQSGLHVGLPLSLLRSWEAMSWIGMHGLLNLLLRILKT